MLINIEEMDKDTDDHQKGGYREMMTSQRLKEEAMKDDNENAI